jgi:hypothetical protein
MPRKTTDELLADIDREKPYDAEHEIRACGDQT